MTPATCEIVSSGGKIIPASRKMMAQTFFVASTMNERIGKTSDGARQAFRVVRKTNDGTRQTFFVMRQMNDIPSPTNLMAWQTFYVAWKINGAAWARNGAAEFVCAAPPRPANPGHLIWNSGNQEGMGLHARVMGLGKGNHSADGAMFYHWRKLPRLAI